MEATIFIGTIIAGVTQAIKLLSEKVKGIVTVVVAILVGLLVALVDTQIGIADISIAQGIVIAIGTIGTMTAIDRV